MRSPEYLNGRREGVKWAIAWLHQRASQMNDENAKAVLNTAAFNMGNSAKQQNIDTPQTQSEQLTAQLSVKPWTYRD